MGSRFVSASSTGDTADRFTSAHTPAASTEDLLQGQTVGLVHLSDFRKRRAEALEQREWEREESVPSAGSTTPHDSTLTSRPAKKKKKKAPARGKLSFGLDDDGNKGAESSTTSSLPGLSPMVEQSELLSLSHGQDGLPKKRLNPNAAAVIVPKAQSKSSKLRVAQTQEELRKRFISERQAVKATEISIPFVFYDGTNVPGGSCRVKKGDHIWFFLDKARKLGAELGVGGDKSRRDWARVSVDDLMLVRGDVIIPHHYEFYYFITRDIAGFSGPLFAYSSLPTAATLSVDDLDTDLTLPGLDSSERSRTSIPRIPDDELEGAKDDPTITKVVDRRWYEQNKHIFPASVWEEYSPDKDLSKIRWKDAEGNTLFFA